jgi:dTDP-D-glucose 4,6-dehydratase
MGTGFGFLVWCILLHIVAYPATLCNVMQSALNVVWGKGSQNRGWLGLEIDIGIVLAIVSIGLSLAGAKYAMWKQKAKQLKMTVDLLVAATEDDKVSEEEFKGIAASVKKLVSGDSEASEE